MLSGGRGGSIGSGTPQGNLDGELAASPDQPAQTGNWLELALSRGSRWLAPDRAGSLVAKWPSRWLWGAADLNRRGFEEILLRNDTRGAILIIEDRPQFVIPSLTHYICPSQAYDLSSRRPNRSNDGGRRHDRVTER